MEESLAPFHLSLKVTRATSDQSLLSEWADGNNISAWEARKCGIAHDYAWNNIWATVLEELAKLYWVLNSHLKKCQWMVLSFSRNHPATFSSSDSRACGSHIRGGGWLSIVQSVTLRLSPQQDTFISIADWQLQHHSLSGCDRKGRRKQIGMRAGVSQQCLISGKGPDANSEKGVWWQRQVADMKPALNETPGHTKTHSWCFSSPLTYPSDQRHFLKYRDSKDTELWAGCNPKQSLVQASHHTKVSTMPWTHSMTKPEAAGCGRTRRTLLLSHMSARNLRSKGPCWPETLRLLYGEMRKPSTPTPSSTLSPLSGSQKCGGLEFNSRQIFWLQIDEETWGLRFLNTKILLRRWDSGLICRAGPAPAADDLGCYWTKKFLRFPLITWIQLYPSLLHFSLNMSILPLPHS